MGLISRRHIIVGNPTNGRTSKRTRGAEMFMVRINRQWPRNEFGSVLIEFHPFFRRASDPTPSSLRHELPDPRGDFTNIAPDPGVPGHSSVHGYARCCFRHLAPISVAGGFASTAPPN